MIRLLSVLIFTVGYPAFIPQLLQDAYQHCRSHFEVLATMFWFALLLVLWVAGLFWLMSLIPWGVE
jgi:hypothetical protein